MLYFIPYFFWSNHYISFICLNHKSYDLKWDHTMYPNIRWLLCCTGFSLWGFTGQVLEFIIFVLVYVILPNLYLYHDMYQMSIKHRSNSNNNIIILLLYIHWIKLYIVVSHFQKKDDIDSSRWLFSNLPDLSLYFVLSCHLFVVSFTYHPSWLIVVLSYIHIVYITGCEYVLHYLHLPQQYHRSPRTLIWHSTLHFDVMDPHYEGLVDWDCTPPFLRDASLKSIRGAYEMGGVQSLNWRPHVHCCGVVWYNANIYRLQRGSSYGTSETHSAPVRFASSIVGYIIRTFAE